MSSKDSKQGSGQATNKTPTTSSTNKSHARQQPQAANLIRHVSSGSASNRSTNSSSSSSSNNNNNNNGKNHTSGSNNNNGNTNRGSTQRGARKPGPCASSAATNVCREMSSSSSSPLNKNKRRSSKEVESKPQAKELEDSNEMATTTFPGTQESCNKSSDGQVVVEQETDVDGRLELAEQIDQRQQANLGRPGCNKEEGQEEDDDDDENSVLLVELEQEGNTSQASMTARLSSAPIKSARCLSTNSDLSAERPAMQTIGSRATEEGQPQGQANLPTGWEQHSDKEGLYYWHVSSGVIQRHRPTMSELSPRKNSLVFYHDDEEINQAQQSSSDEEDYFESGAVLTQADDPTMTSEPPAFVVYLLGRAEFDETQLASNTSTKAIQKCILRLCNKPAKEETVCWGLDQSSPVLMRLCDDYIQFTDIKTRALLRSQPIQTIKTWAVDDDNNFAFVIEECASQALAKANESATSFLVDSVDDALLSEPVLMCYVFRSMDDDDMSCKVAAKLNEEIGRYKEQLSNRISRSTRLQQMVEPQRRASDESTDADEDFEELEASSELTLNVKYIGQTPVPRPTGIDVLNAAIDKCLAEASKAHAQAQAKLRLDQEDILELAGVSSSSSRAATQEASATVSQQGSSSPGLIEAKLHVSPSSVIVENVLTGEIIVECRIRYLTFIGISRRDIRWCGFIMQNGISSKSFVAHSFECSPTAGHACEAMQQSCNKMYEKVIRNNSSRQPETMSIIPSGSKIRNTLAKTFSRIKLNPIS